jgi:hypothetical protein
MGHSPTDIIVLFWNVWDNLNFMQVGIKHTTVDYIFTDKGIQLKSKLQQIET